MKSRARLMATRGRSVQIAWNLGERLVQILDVMRKALEGKPMSENDYQLRTFSPKVQEKRRQYRIKYDPENPVPSDDSLADDVFKAGFELMAEVGSYCITTGRVMSFSEQEIKEP